MTTRNRHVVGVGKLWQSGSWIALPVALLANALLFSVLAGARTTPSRPRVLEAAPMRIRLTELPRPDSAATYLSLTPTDRIAIGPSEAAIVTSPTLATVTATLTPRLSNGLAELPSEMPGLPVNLPGVSNLRSAPVGASSTIAGPFSQAQVDRIPRKLTGGLPRYPLWARRAGLEGTVTLRFVVTSQGAVTDISIHHIQGDECFGREAIRAVASWRFDPAVKQGIPVPYWFFYTVNFRLKE